MNTILQSIFLKFIVLLLAAVVFSVIVAPAPANAFTTSYATNSSSYTPSYSTNSSSYTPSYATNSSSYTPSYSTNSSSYTPSYSTNSSSYDSSYYVDTSSYDSLYNSYVEEDWLSCGYVGCSSYVPTYTHTTCGSSCCGSSCNNPPRCSNDCSVSGMRQCSGNGYQQCNKGSDGCLHWSNVTSCGSGQSCNNGSCISSCSDQCSTNGQRRCSGNGFQQCGNYNSDSCLEWGSVVTCASNETCNNGSCIPHQTCTNDCDVNNQRVCDGNGFKQCSKGSDGCFHWGTINNCQTGELCSNGSCISHQTCTNDCDVNNQRVCDGNGFKQCSKGSDGCFHWGTINNCQTGELCNNGSCIPHQTCTNDCSRDQRVCDGNGYKQCSQGSDGCLHWSGITNCQTSETCNNGSCNNYQPTVSLRTNGSVTCNQSATLSWSSTNADSCNASGSWSGSKVTNGSESVGSFTGRRTYTIVCTGRGGSATDSVSLDGSRDNLSVNAGSDKYVTDNNSVDLDGSVKGDADRLNWSCTGGSLSNDEALKPEWRSADSYGDRNSCDNNDSDRTYTCTLTARNECGSDSDSMTIHVRHNCQPTVYPVRTVYEVPTVYPVKTNYSQVSQVNIQKWVTDLSNGSPWSISVNASPADAVSYKIIVTAVQGDTENISVSDAMPAGIANVRNLQIDGVGVNGDLSSATNIGGLRQGQTRIITFDATVANENVFPYGQTALTNTATVFANGATANASATVNVYRHAVMGATTVSTGFDGNTVAGIGLGIAAAFLGITLFIKKAFAPKGRDAEAELAQRLALIKRNELA